MLTLKKRPVRLALGISLQGNPTLNVASRSKTTAKRGDAQPVGKFRPGPVPMGLQQVEHRECSRRGVGHTRKFAPH